MTGSRSLDTPQRAYNSSFGAR